jgi:hypothetical protein
LHHSCSSQREQVLHKFYQRFEKKIISKIKTIN